jgi:hypothetical protein
VLLPVIHMWKSFAATLLTECVGNRAHSGWESNFDLYIQDEKHCANADCSTRIR